MGAEKTWEQAVVWLRNDPAQSELVRWCYYDDPLSAAAERFARSDEWAAVRRLLPQPPGRALDLGAGRGIASFALAKDGWSVTAAEPDPSPIVGAGAIRTLADECRLALSVVESPGESLPVPDASFDVVYMRGSLHHAKDLGLLCREVSRVLRRGGTFLGTREHVITQHDDLPLFLSAHPLHHLYGGENAHRLEEYLLALRASGLRVDQVIGPYDSVVNYFPMSSADWERFVMEPVARRVGARAARVLLHRRHALGRWAMRAVARRLSRKDDSPGRHFGFLARKP